MQYERDMKERQKVKAAATKSQEPGRAIELPKAEVQPLSLLSGHTEDVHSTDRLQCDTGHASKNNPHLGLRARERKL